MLSEEEFDQLWKNLVTRKHDTSLTPLNENETIFYALNLLRGSIPRSGFIGYFENTISIDILHAYNALKQLSLNEAYNKLKEAQKIALGDRDLPSDNIMIEIFPSSLTQEEYEKASDEMDLAFTSIEEEFMAYDDQIYDSLCQHATKHQLNKNG